MLVKVKAAQEADEVVTQPAQHGVARPWPSCHGFVAGALDHTLQNQQAERASPTAEP